MSALRQKPSFHNLPQCEHWKPPVGGGASIAEWSSGLPSGIARNGEFVEPGQADLGRPVPFAKIFLFSAHPNHPYIRRHPVPLEGRIAIVTSAGRDAMVVKMLLTNSVCADGEVVWS
jgi:hypothetical protein